MTVSVLDVAKYVLEKTGPMTAMKLQKLVYYSQAWSLVWDEEPLFGERVQAWADGPVVRELYDAHHGRFTVAATDLPGDASRLNADQRETVDAVLEYYGDKSAHWLSELTHQERPWLDARAGLGPGERGNAQISYGAMTEYYSKLSSSAD